MTVHNPVREAQLQAIPTTTTPESLAKAIAQLDLSSVPPEKRAMALLDHVSRVMVGTMVNRSDAHSLIAARFRALQPPQ